MSAESEVAPEMLDLRCFRLAVLMPLEESSRGVEWRRSIFAWQVDYIICEIKRDGFQRKIGVRDLFAEDNMPGAVVASEGGSFVRLNF